jgi:hypothetical protein
VRTKAERTPLAVSNRLRALQGTTSAGIIAIWIAISLIVIGAQASWSALQSHLHPATIEIVSDALLRGPGRSNYVVLIVRNASTNIAEDVRAFAQDGVHEPREASNNVAPSVLRIAPMQESVFVFSGLGDVSLANLHFSVGVGSWTMPQLWKALPTVSWTGSQGKYHVVVVNSSSFTTQPVRLLAVAFGPHGKIRAIGGAKIHGLGPLLSDDVNMRIRIGNASVGQSTSFFEEN